LFSVGVVLYQLLTDKRPFDGDNDFSIIHQIIGHNPPAPSTINDKLPSAIDAVVARALAKNRDERFATARDFASALQSAIRRAEDQTIVPPANPQKKPDAGGTGSRGGQSIAGALTSPSTVTQEVELVYWKDIKDSTEAEEFDAFLDKFPAGIYADLARKRLRKLQGGGIWPDQTVLSGTMTGGSAQREGDDEATRLRTGTTPSVVSAASPIVPPPVVPAQPPVAASEPEPSTGPESDFPETITMVRSEVPLATAAPAPAPAPAPAMAPKVEARPTPPATPKPPAPAKARKPAATPKASAKKPPVAVIAGVGAALVIGIAAFAMMGRGSKAPDANLAALPAASAAASSAPVESPPATEPPVAVPVAAVSAPAATRAPAASEPIPTASTSAHRPSRPAPARVAAKPKVVPSAAPVEAAPPPPAPRVQPREAPKPAPVPSSASALAAVDACKDKVFFAREFCLSDNCDKAGARNHPMCVKWREEKRLRENSRIGN
jgi:serine/threonine-protein kinase